MVSQSQSEVDSVTQATVSACPLQINISVSKQTFIIGEEIPVTVIYKNVSQQNIRVLGLTVWAHPLYFDVLDSQGNHSVTIRAKRKYGVNYQKDFVELKPGETLQRIFDINQFFIFKEPDTYAVTAYYSAFWELPETPSNTIQIQLVR